MEKTREGRLRSRWNMSSTAGAILAALLMLNGATTAEASGRRSMPLAEMITNSRAVFVATVVAVDEFALQNSPGFDPATLDLNRTSALTKYTLSVDEVLLGTIANKTLNLTMRGGVLPDGELEEWTTVPQLAEGDAYIIFLRNGQYTVTPIVMADSAVLRFVEYQGKRLLVDEEGLALALTSDGEFRRSGRAAESARQKRKQQRIDQASTHEVLASSAQISQEAVDTAADAEDVLRYLRRVTRDVTRGQMRTELVGDCEPMPLDGALK